MEKPRFGENFQVDPTNRMEIFGVEKLPEYVELSCSGRERLKETIESEGWPEVPKNLESVEDFFNTASAEVNQRWDKHLQELLDQKREQWLRLLPDNEEAEEIRRLLTDAEDFTAKFNLRRFGVLEQLRGVLPEAWRSLVLLSSEKQLAGLTLMRHWSKELPAEAFSKINLSKTELKLFLDMAGILGKYIDHAYVKQIELADQPGGSEKTKLTEKMGSSYLYDLYASRENDDVETKHYVDVFPAEWPRLVKRFNALSARVNKMLAEGKLPEQYKGLPEYLKQMADTYGSRDITPESLGEKWDALSDACRELALAGCPLMLIPQGCEAVAGEANKVDVELRFGIITEQSRELTENFEPFREIGQAIVDDHASALKEPTPIPGAFFNYQPFAFGPNSYFFTTAESSEELIISHTNAIGENALYTEGPLITKMFDQAIVPTEHVKAGTIDTTLHEISHRVISNEDEAVFKRIGSDANANIIEELKAEVVSMKLLDEYAQAGNPGINFETQLLVKLGVICNYLTNHSNEAGSLGERYYYSAIAMLAKLLESGIIKNQQGKYQISEARQGIKALAQMGDEIINLYTNPLTGKNQIDQYIETIRQQEKMPEVEEFLQQLKA